MIQLDTHVVVWLYDGRADRLPVAVQALIEKNELAISPMVALELQYLHEIGRLQVTSDAILVDLNGRIGIRTSSAPFARVIEVARDLAWTRDPFDRIIVATAIVDDVPLLTRDETLLSHCSLARWDEAAATPAATSRRKRAKRTRRADS